MDDFDVEDLKVRKIKPPKKAGRVHLPVAGPRGPQTGPATDVSEAFGGSGERDDVVGSNELEERIIQTLKSIFDPEIPVNVYDLGLIYGLTISDDGDVEVEMTLTAPACPVAGMIVTDVAERVGRTRGVRKSHVKLVWEPAWTKARMTEDALLELGLL